MERERETLKISSVFRGTNPFAMEHLFVAQNVGKRSEWKSCPTSKLKVKEVQVK